MESIAPLLVVGVLLVVSGTWLATKIASPHRSSWSSSASS
ncbi:hypothetical protein FHX72_002732 [Pseudoclavibacter helvolus]|uniref:Uncharacterized protein n=1 Tax=Pseudoclavibacter helvolus TaxID=255205 RepID=A0A7W4UQA4_9MICO|nr:hypothetical protein [Pseudoclavibacter helvolus]